MPKLSTLAAIALIAGTVTTACSAADRSASASSPPAPSETLTGQDIGEANGALDALVEAAIADTGIDIRGYLVLRVLSRGPQPSPREFYDDLVAQRQLKLDQATAVGTVTELESRGLLTGASPDGPGPVALTEAGKRLNDDLTGRTAPIAAKVFGGIDPDDLQTAHRVLADVTSRARELRGQR